MEPTNPNANTCTKTNTQTFDTLVGERSCGTLSCDTFVTLQTLLQDTLVGHSYGSVLWTLVQHSCGTLLWGTLVGHSCRALLRNTLVGLCRTLLDIHVRHSCVSLLWGTLAEDARAGRSCGTVLWDLRNTLVGHSGGTLFCDTLVYHFCGTLL